jgi:aminoglycoside phosphotransferase (APT) family kinase protein
MSTFAATVANPDADDVMISSTRAAIERLRSAVLPVAFEHGDASHPNLFRRDDGSVAAVDWECAEPDGLPAHDLTTVLAYVAVARSGAKTPPDQGRAIASALFDAGGWAPAATRDHLARIGVDPDLARALTLVALARLTIGLVQRLGAGPADTPSAETTAFVRSHRYHLAWRSVAADGGSPRWPGATRA